MAVHEGKGGVRAVGREGGLPNVQYDKVCYRSYYEEIRGPGSSAAIAPTTTRSEGFPAILRRAGSNACFAADEFFSAQLSNPHTRRAYGRAVGRFLAWCDAQGIELSQVTPGLAGRFIEEAARRSRH